MVTEQNLLESSIQDLAGASFNCSCGKHHQVDIEQIVVSNDALDHIGRFAQKMCTVPGSKVLIVSDNNTYVAYGEKVVNRVSSLGIETISYSFFRDEPLVPDELAVGELLLAIPENTSCIIAVGSGTMNDLCRFISYKTHIPYAIAATAPSVDGYASTVSPLMIKGHKTTLDGVYPKAIFAEPQVLCKAPDVLIQAGFGDLLGKVTALADWELSRHINHEYFCPAMNELVKKALVLCMSNTKGIADRESAAVSLLFEALVLSGFAMGMTGNSRPASGAEHHLAHYWEMDALKNHREHPLHGNSVGSGTIAVARAYEYMKDLLPEGFILPDTEELMKMLSTVGSSVTPFDLGITKELFHSSMNEAMYVRPRYTILVLASENGRLPMIADRLTKEFYH